MMAQTLELLRQILNEHPLANEAIFWWSFCWSSGKGSDLYKVLCEVPYEPTPGRDVTKDPEVVKLIRTLDEMFGPLTESELQPIKLADVQEGEIIMAGAHFMCLLNRWPCRVFKHHGGLGVACGGGVGHVGKPGEYFWHPLTEDKEGYVIGFRR